MSTVRELREMMEKATQSEWIACKSDGTIDIGRKENAEFTNGHDAVLAAAMRNHFAALLDLWEADIELNNPDLSDAEAWVAVERRDNALKRLEAGHG